MSSGLDWEQITRVPFAECATEGCEWTCGEARDAKDQAQKHARDYVGHTSVVVRVSESFYTSPLARAGASA